MVKGKFWNVLSLIVSVLFFLSVALLVVNIFFNVGVYIEQIFYNAAYLILLPLSIIDEFTGLTIDTNIFAYVFVAISLVWFILCILKLKNKARILNIIFTIFYAIWFGLAIYALIYSGYINTNILLPLTIFSFVGVISCLANVVVIAKNRGR